MSSSVDQIYREIVEKEALAARVKGRLSLYRKRVFSEIKELEEELFSQSEDKSLVVEVADSLQTQELMEEGSVRANGNNLSVDTGPYSERKSGSVHSAKKSSLKNEPKLVGSAGRTGEGVREAPVPAPEPPNGERPKRVPGEYKLSSKSLLYTKKSSFSRKNLKGERAVLNDSHASDKRPDDPGVLPKGQLGSKIRDILEASHRSKRTSSKTDNIDIKQLPLFRRAKARVAADLQNALGPKTTGLYISERKKGSRSPERPPFDDFRYRSHDRFSPGSPAESRDSPTHPPPDLKSEPPRNSSPDIPENLPFLRSKDERTSS